MSDLISTATSTDEAKRRSAVAVVPVGSFEQHGPFLPLSTDTLVACTIANAIRDAYPVLLLPPITISCSHEHAGWAGTVSVSARTLHQVISDIAESLRSADVDRLVLVNGHGGNYVLANIVQEASRSGPAMALFPSGPDWSAARKDAGIVTSSHQDMHAGELETSILLYAHPSVVRAGNETADWRADDRPHLLTLGVRGYTESGVIGQPSLGTAAKGAAVVASLVRRYDATHQLLTKNTHH